MGITTLIKELTASNSATLSFVHGTSDVVLDGTYDEYMFVWTDVGPATDDVFFTFQGSIDAGSNYNVSATTACFRSSQSEAAATAFAYDSTQDRATQTVFIPITAGGLGNGADESSAGILHLFNPSSTTYYKNFICRSNLYHASDYIYDFHMSGYFGDADDDIDAIQFKMSSGNFDGVIQLYGIA